MEVPSSRQAILVMAHKRPSHLRHALNALRSADRFSEHSLVVILDGDFPAVRKVVSDQIDPDVLIQVSHPESMSARQKIHRNLSLGLMHAFSDSRVDYCVVLEDDIVVGRDFLSFVDTMMSLGRNDPWFRAVNGFSNFASQSWSDDRAFVRANFGVGWGWALPRRTYVQISRVLERRGDYHWDSLIEPQIRSGYVVNPVRSLVLNAGLDGSGSHTGSEEDSHLAQLMKASFDTTKDRNKQEWGRRVVPLEWRADYVLIDALPQYLRFLVYFAGRCLATIEKFSYDNKSKAPRYLSQIRRTLRKKFFSFFGRMSQRQARKRPSVE